MGKERRRRLRHVFEGGKRDLGLLPYLTCISTVGEPLLYHTRGVGRRMGRSSTG